MAALVGCALFLVARLWVPEPLTVGVAIIAMDSSIIVPYLAPTYETAAAWFEDQTAGLSSKGGTTSLFTTKPAASRIDEVAGAEPTDTKEYDRTVFFQNGDTVVYHAPLTILGTRFTFEPHTISREAAHGELLNSDMLPTPFPNGVYPSLATATTLEMEDELVSIPPPVRTETPQQGTTQALRYISTAFTDLIQSKLQEWALRIYEKCKAIGGEIANIPYAALTTGLLAVLAAGFLLIRKYSHQASATIGRWMGQGLRASGLILVQLESWIMSTSITPLYYTWNGVVASPTLMLKNIRTVLIRERRYSVGFAALILCPLVLVTFFIQRHVQGLIAKIRRLDDSIQTIRVGLGAPLDWLLRSYPIFGSLVMTGLSLSIGLFIVQPILNSLWDFIALYVAGLPFGEDVLFRNVPVLGHVYKMQVQHDMHSTHILKEFLSVLTSNIWEQFVKSGQMLFYGPYAIFEILRASVRATLIEVFHFASSMVESGSRTLRTLCEILINNSMSSLRLLQSLSSSLIEMASGVARFVFLVVGSIFHSPVTMLLKEFHVFTCKKLILCGTQKCSIGWEYLILVPWLTIWTSLLLILPYIALKLSPNLWPIIVASGLLFAFTVHQRECAQENMIVCGTLLFWFLAWCFSRQITQASAFIDRRYNGELGRRLAKVQYDISQWWLRVTTPDTPLSITHLANIELPTSLRNQEELATVVEKEEAAAETEILRKEAKQPETTIDRSIVNQVDADVREPDGIVEVDDFEDYMPTRRSISVRQSSEPTFGDPLDYVPFELLVESTLPNNSTPLGDAAQGSLEHHEITPIPESALETPIGVGLDDEVKTPAEGPRVTISRPPNPESFSINFGQERQSGSLLATQAQDFPPSAVPSPVTGSPILLKVPESSTEGPAETKKQYTPVVQIAEEDSKPLEPLASVPQANITFDSVLADQPNDEAASLSSLPQPNISLPDVNRMEIAEAAPAPAMAVVNNEDEQACKPSDVSWPISLQTSQDAPYGLPDRDQNVENEERKEESASEAVDVVLENTDAPLDTGLDPNYCTDADVLSTDAMDESRLNEESEGDTEILDAPVEPSLQDVQVHEASQEPSTQISGDSQGESQDVLQQHPITPQSTNNWPASMETAPPQFSFQFEPSPFQFNPSRFQFNPTQTFNEATPTPTFSTNWSAQSFTFTPETFMQYADPQNLSHGPNDTELNPMLSSNNNFTSTAQPIVAPSQMSSYVLPSFDAPIPTSQSSATPPRPSQLNFQSPEIPVLSQDTIVRTSPMQTDNTCNPPHDSQDGESDIDMSDVQVSKVPSEQAMPAGYPVTLSPKPQTVYRPITEMVELYRPHLGTSKFINNTALAQNKKLLEQNPNCMPSLPTDSAYREVDSKVLKAHGPNSHQFANTQIMQKWYHPLNPDNIVESEEDSDEEMAQDPTPVKAEWDSQSSRAEQGGIAHDELRLQTSHTAEYPAKFRPDVHTEYDSSDESTASAEANSHEQEENRVASLKANDESREEEYQRKLEREAESMRKAQELMDELDRKARELEEEAKASYARMAEDSSNDVQNANQGQHKFVPDITDALSADSSTRRRRSMEEAHEWHQADLTEEQARYMEEWGIKTKAELDEITGEAKVDDEYVDDQPRSLKPRLKAIPRSKAQPRSSKQMQSSMGLARSEPQTTAVSSRERSPSPAMEASSGSSPSPAMEAPSGSSPSPPMQPPSGSPTPPPEVQSSSAPVYRDYFVYNNTGSCDSEGTYYDHEGEPHDAFYNTNTYDLETTVHGQVITLMQDPNATGPTEVFAWRRIDDKLVRWTGM
ncbi:hypothetical protein IAQ61_008326 [Plenodomus lingam]|uniref:uncharacterized protein n=1 Tax=Leptosphaeria maculans TaxID=5022 RepID=UPI00332CFBF4|nr:hypothetical protein IAQ61_008326 [Plenodomus lingam]